MECAVRISQDNSSHESEWRSRAIGLMEKARDALAQAQDLNTITAIVRTAARTLVEADGATFVLKDGDKCYYVDEDAISLLWKGKRFPISECVSGWVMMNAIPTTIPDINKDDRILTAAYRSTFVKSLAMVPIRQSGPIGAIGTYWAVTRQATNAEIEILQELGQATSAALERLGLIDAMSSQ